MIQSQLKKEHRLLSDIICQIIFKKILSFWLDFHQLYSLREKKFVTKFTNSVDFDLLSGSMQ